MPDAVLLYPPAIVARSPLAVFFPSASYSRMRPVTSPPRVVSGLVVVAAGDRAVVITNQIAITSTHKCVRSAHTTAGPAVAGRDVGI